MGRSLPVTNMVNLGNILLSELCGLQIREILIHRQSDLLHHLATVMLEQSCVNSGFLGSVVIYQCMGQKLWDSDVMK
jgi:hypothetical protein